MTDVAEPSPAPARPSWLRRAALGAATESRRLLRRLLNLDADRNTIEAALLRIDRRLEDFAGPTGRVALVERRAAALDQALRDSVSQLEAAGGHSEQRLLSALAALKADAAALGTAMRESFSGVKAAGAQSEQRLRDAVAALQAEGTAGEQRQAALQQQNDARLRELIAALRAALEQAEAHILRGADAAESLAALQSPFADLFARVIFLEKAAAHAPIYTQAGLNAIVRLGGWDEQLTLVVPTSHVGVLETFHTLGPHTVEPGVRALIRRVVRPEHSVVDIGAHVGLHAVVLGDIVRERGRLVAFEPDPELAAALMQTFVMNGFTRAGAVVNAAVSDRDGEAQFHRTLHSPESSLFGVGDAPGRDTVVVRTVALDSQFRPGERVDFAKIDAEGAEPAIVRGMARVLADNPGLSMVMECAPQHLQRAGEDPGAFHDALVAHGFRIEAVAEPDGATTPVTRDRVMSSVTLNLWLTPAKAQAPGASSARR